MKYSKGFTLAEMLVTLTIVGIVASLTIPDLVQTVQGGIYKTSWKSTYSNLDQATRLLMLDNNDSMVNIAGTWDDIAVIYKTKLASSRYCTNSAAQRCWHSYVYWVYLNNTAFSGNEYVGPDLTNPANKSNVTFPGLVLSNGTLLNFLFTSSSCTSSYSSAGIPICGWVLADINGFNGPNMVGKDIFGAWITSNGLKPIGYSGDYAHGGGYEGTGFVNSRDYLLN